MIKVDPEFKALIPPLTPEEFKQLEENCVKDGIRDALITWNGILIDGHNRFRIAAKHSLHWNEKKVEFASRDEAKLWIIDNQLGRRNLPTIDRVTLEDKKKGILAKRAEAKKISNLKQNVSSEDKKSCPRQLQTRQEKRENSTDYKIAKSAGTSEDTVRKVRIINEKAAPEVIEQIRSGKKSINGAFNEIKERERKKIDLSAKAHLEKAEERHEDFQKSKTVSITDVVQDKKDAVEIARGKSTEIYTAIKKLLFIGAINYDYSIISTKTMSEAEIKRLTGEIDIAIGVLQRIKAEIGR